MKHTTPDALLTRELLTAVRDGRPTPGAFIARFGDEAYHILLKARVFVLEGEQLRLSRRHLTPDGRRFLWGIRYIHLDDDVVELVRWGASGPPIFNEEE